MTFSYNPTQNLIKVSGTDEAKAIWDFLIQRDNIVRAETATYLKKPALEPIIPLLFNKFAVYNPESTDKQTHDKYKQLAGNMISQIMQSKGYEVDRTGVTILTSKIFKTAARYKKK